MKGIVFALIVGVTTLTVFSGCGVASGPTFKVEKEQKVFRIAKRKFAPEPVSYRLRWVHLPEVVPTRSEGRRVAKERILPVVELDLQDSTLKEAALVVAASARYGSYCSSKIANVPFSLTMLGTIDELGAAIAEKASIDVVIDHANREIRFLPKAATEKATFFKK